MKYFARFNENGERAETHAADGMPYSYRELKNMTEFVELSEEDYEKYCAGYVRGTDGKPVKRAIQEQPAEQTHEKVDPTILALAEAVAAQEVRLSALEGGEKA